MKILVIIISNEFSEKYRENIIIIDKFLKEITTTIDYCGISSNDDFNTYEDIIQFKYKEINKKKQFSKICDFIQKNDLHYDWFIKIRPEITLLENINFNTLMHNAINARARVYYGMTQIPYGCSVGGMGDFSMHKECKADNYEHDIILDDQIFIFDKEVINSGAFEYIQEDDNIPQNEYSNTIFWNSKKIKLNIISINMIFQKFNAYSGNVPNIIETFVNYNNETIFFFSDITFILFFIIIFCIIYCIYFYKYILLFFLKRKYI